MSKRFIIGTRGSKLALAQSELIIKKLQRLNPDALFETRIIKTKGDLVQDRSLVDIGGKGLFVREIEQRLLANQIDLAVHSLKDLPYELPPDLTLGAVPQRGDPRDVLILGDYNQDLNVLPEGFTFGTGSLRRKVFIKKLFPSASIRLIRGNLDTRIRKLKNGEYDGICVAAAGLRRLGMMRSYYQVLPVEVFPPAACQGTLAVEVRSDDDEVLSLVSKLDNYISRSCAMAERAFLEGLNGSCRLPISAYCCFSEGYLLRLNCLIASPEGDEIHTEQQVGSVADARDLGLAAAERILKKCSRKILDLLDRG